MRRNVKLVLGKVRFRDSAQYVRCFQFYQILGVVIIVLLDAKVNVVKMQQEFKITAVDA